MISHASKGVPLSILFQFGLVRNNRRKPVPKIPGTAIRLLSGVRLMSFCEEDIEATERAARNVLGRAAARTMHRI